MTITAINPQAFAKLCNEGKKIDLIDVRTPVEYREVHVEIARNVPLDQLNPAALMQAAIRHLPFWRPRPASVREVPQGRLLECGQHRGRHDGVRSSWPSGHPW